MLNEDMKNTSKNAIKMLMDFQVCSLVSISKVSSTKIWVRVSIS